MPPAGARRCRRDEASDNNRCFGHRRTLTVCVRAPLARLYSGSVSGTWSPSSAFPLTSRLPSIRSAACLRRRFVRRLLRYYAAVRLPIVVHHRRSSIDFPTRPAAPSLARGQRPDLPVPAQYVSAHARGLRPRGACCTRLSRQQSCLRVIAEALGTPDSALSRLNTRPMRSPVNASPAELLLPTHDSEPDWLARPCL